MSPIGSPPSITGVIEGEDDGVCTYNNLTRRINTQERGGAEENMNRIATSRSTNPPKNICRNVHRRNVNDILESNPIRAKPRRNTEQRRPGKITLEDFFPIIKNNENLNQITNSTNIARNTHQQYARPQVNTKVQAKLEQYDLGRNKKPIYTTQQVGIITPPGESGKKRHKSKKTSRKLRNDKPLTTAPEPIADRVRKSPNYRQSILYNYDDWIGNQENFKTAGNFFGHSMAQIDNTSVYRVFLQNPNGIDPNPDNQDFQLSLQTCYDQCISFIGLTETNTEWNHYQQRENLQKSVKKWWDGARIQTSTSSISFRDKYKPGGTVSILCGSHWCSRVVESGEDVCGMGRSTHIGLQGSQHTKVLNITWYRVCKQSKENVGVKTAYMQQYAILRERFPELDPDPRRQSVLDMQLFIMRKIEEGYFIILCTDGNENLSSTKRRWCTVESTTNHAFEQHHDGSILTLLNTCDLVDVLQLQHNQDNYPPTYIRGRSRIDGIFVSRSIVHCVLRSGLTPFHTFFGGDHRGVYVDFSASLLFKSNTYELARPQGRGLQLKDPRKVAKYLTTLHGQLAYHKVIKKHEQLSQIPEGAWTNADTIKYEKLDKIAVQSALYAEKTIACRYSTQYQWSPALLKEVYVLRYARLRLKEAKGLPVTNNSIQYHKKQAGITDSQHRELTAIEKIVNFLRQARKNLKEYQKRHVELRRSYIEELAEAIVQKRFPTAEVGTCFFDDQKTKQLKALCNRESAKLMHMKIRSALNRTQGGGLSRIDIPDSSILFSSEGQSLGDPNDPKTWKGSWLTVTDPERLEDEIIKMNVKQYHQAIDTPFGQEPLATLFGPDGTTDFVRELLQGKPLTHELKSQLTEATVKFLEVLQRPAPQLYRKRAEITPAQYTSSYKRLNESISSSVSGMHLGHWKAALESPSLVQMYATKMSLPYIHGFDPERWKLVVDVCLPKDEGKYYSHRMRIIRLVESDFNQSLGMIFARPMGHFMEDTNAYPEMQFGSRDGQMSISAVLNKILTYDIARMERRVLAIEENDAIGCYDRIHQAPVSAFLQQMGVSVASLHCVCRTFDEAEHFIKTSYGLSKRTYRGSKEVPLFGAGQGTTGGPFFWLLMFKIIYDAMSTTARGMTFVSPCKTHTSDRLGEAFVDDTAFGTTPDYAEPQNDPALEQIRDQELEVLSLLTLLGQQYEKLLHATGGALNLAKCFWVLVSWRWKEGKAYLKTCAEAPLQLLLTSGYNTQPQEVPRLESSTAYRTLGVYIAANGSMRKALSLHRQTSEIFAGQLSCSHLSRSEAYFAYVLYFYPKISYSLPVTTFTRKECTFLQAPAMAAFLPKLGLNRHTARSIINGPSQLGGLQLPDVYADQSIGQLRLFLGHLRRGDHTSRLLSIAISILQLRIGSGVLFLNLPYPKYEGWVEHTWLTSLWKFLHLANLRVQVPSSIRFPSKQREHDSFIMTEFIYQGFSKLELDQINQCRLYHQVITVSDIAQADGIQIDAVYLGRSKHQDRLSPLQWPAQGIPSSKAWTQWNRALKYLQNKGKLKQPLGRWLTRPHQQWGWVVSIEDMVLYHKLPKGWERYDSLLNLGEGRTRSKRKLWFSKEHGRISRGPAGRLAVATPHFSEVDSDLFTISISPELPQPRLHQAQESDGTSITSSHTSEPLQVPNYKEAFTSSIEASSYFRRLIGPLMPPTDADLLEIAGHIATNSLLVCSDGSFSPSSGNGSHAWVFSTEAGDILLQGAGPIDCIPQLLSSYRPELGGITANLFLLTVIVKVFDIKEGSVTLFCDNRSALENVFDPVPKRGIYPLLAVDYDLLVLAKDLLSALPIQINHEWVKGHYTGDERMIQHDLNSLVDSMADKFLQNPPRGYVPTSSPLYHPRHAAIVMRQGSMITSKLKQVVYEQLFHAPLVATICKRYRWTVAEFQQIDWDLFGKTFRSYSKFSQIGIAKFVHGQWNTGEQKVKYKQDAAGLCPCCGTTQETIPHVFQCASSTMVSYREQELHSLGEFLDEQDLPTQMKQCLYHGITEWTRSIVDAPRYIAPTRGKVTAVDQLATQAYVEQTQLGWNALLRGHLSITWRKVYRQAHRIVDEQTMDILFRRLIRKLHQFSLSLWKHRNEILHGATWVETRAVELSLARGKVEEAFQRYSVGDLQLLERDKYLFTRRTKEERLQGDADALMSWLRIVEVAVNSNERQRKAQEHQVARFFQPFRELGKKNKAARELKLLRAKVEEAYLHYGDGSLELLDRDRTLFTQKPKDARLQDDATQLLQWLQRLELALTSFKRRQQEIGSNAVHLFRPFYALGRRRLLVGQNSAKEADDEDQQLLELDSQQQDSREVCTRGLREQDQIDNELSQQTRSQYFLRKRRLPSVLDSDQTEEDVLSLLLGGPFHQQLLVDQTYSTDSSYQYSQRSDLPTKFDTDHSATSTSIEVTGYITEQKEQREAQLDTVLSRLDCIYRERLARRKGTIRTTSDGSSTDTSYSTTTPEQGSLATVGLMDSTTNESSDSGHCDNQEPIRCDSPAPQASEVQAMLQYLQSRKHVAPRQGPIDHPGSKSSEDSVAVLQVRSPTTSIVCNLEAEITSASSPISESFGNLGRERGQCVIEELSGIGLSQPPEPNHPFLQLAQDSGTSLSSQTTVSTLTEIRDERGIAFCQWYESIQPLEHQMPPSAGTSVLSEGTRATSSSISAPQGRQGLEVLTSTSSTTSSETGEYGGGMEHFALRSIPFHPPMEEEQLSEGSTDVAEDSLPSLTPGLSSMASLGGMSMDGSQEFARVGSPPDWGTDGTVGFTLGSGTSEANGLPLDVDAHDQQALSAIGNLQGSAMSAVEYIAMLESLQGTFDAYEARQLQRLFAGEFYDIDEEEELQEEGSMSLSQPQSETLSETSLGTQIHGGQGFEGSTVGTTATNLSAISVRQIYLSLDSLQVEGLEVEIPFAEQDDPPDDDDTLAAL